MDPANAVNTISTLVTGVELLEKKVSRIQFYCNKYFKRKIRILVYGDSGVGKTQFLNTLTGNNAYIPQRTRIPKKYELTLSSGREIQLIDTPGHQSTEIARNITLDDMTRGKIDGIINLVNYGYQDSDELQKDPGRVFNVDTKEVKPSFLRDNMKLEITRTQEFLKRLNPGVNIDWIITVINKADIWYSVKDDVYEYYTQGPYNDMMSEFEHSVKLFVIPFCSVITPFANMEMKLIYSERDKKNMYDSLVAHLNTLCCK